MKPTALSWFVGLLSAVTAGAAIPVGLQGSGVLTFDTAPAATEWSTLSVGGEGGNARIRTPAELDAEVQLLSAASINLALASTPVVPPSQNNYARWNSVARYLQTRIGNNAYTVVLATLNNDTSANIPFLTIAYDLTMGASILEEIPGYRVYFSFSGEPFTWQAIEELSTDRPEHLEATLRLEWSGTWAPGAPLYVLWVDDNSASGSDGYYTIDNVEFSLGADGVRLTSPVNGRTFPQGVPIPIGASASLENRVIDLTFFDHETLMGNDPLPAYSFVYSNAPLGVRELRAVATDSLGLSVTSAPVQITVVPNVPPSIQRVFPADGEQFLVGTNVTNAVNASDTDGSVVRAEFFVDGELFFTMTNPPYSMLLCDVTAGAHTLAAVAVDDGSVRTTNMVSIVVTNPPGIMPLVGNGETWRYLDDGHGADWGTVWNTWIIDDSGWREGQGRFGYGGGAANRPERTLVSSGPYPSLHYASTYFRKAFFVEDPAVFTNLTLRLLRDDGAIVYLNGSEVFRSGVTNAVVTAGTYTGNSVPDDGLEYQQTSISPALLAPGDNLLAVEVHQESPFSPDMSFDLMLWGMTPPGPALEISISGFQVTLRWPLEYTGYRLQWASDPAGPWESLEEPDVPEPTRHAVNVSADGARRYFRLVKP